MTNKSVNVCTDFEVPDLADVFDADLRSLYERILKTVKEVTNKSIRGTALGIPREVVRLVSMIFFSS